MVGLGGIECMILVVLLLVLVAFAIMRRTRKNSDRPPEDDPGW